VVEAVRSAFRSISIPTDNLNSNLADGTSNLANDGRYHQTQGCSWLTMCRKRSRAALLPQSRHILRYYDLKPDCLVRQHI
jgi:hypothetical protein